MGKAIIKENLGDGLYEIELDRNSKFIQAEIEKIEKRIEEINKRIAKEEKEIDTVTKEILEKLKDQFEKLLLQSKTPLAWCCDMSPNLSGTVETIEIDGEPRKINIAPKNPGFNKILSGDLTPVAAMSPAQAALNFAIHPGWQKFKPTYRLARITKIEGPYCDIEIIDTKSFYQGISINQATVYKNVTVKYMSCDSGAFDVDDIVVVEFENQNFEKPVIIGFNEKPKHCDAYVLVSTKSGAEAVLWDAVTDSVLFEKDTKDEILKKIDKNGFGIPLKCEADGFRTYHETAGHNMGYLYGVYGGDLFDVDYDGIDSYIRTSIPTQFYYGEEGHEELRTLDDQKNTLVLIIPTLAFGNSSERHNWEDGDIIIFQTYNWTTDVTLLNVISAEGVFYPEYINNNINSNPDAIKKPERYINQIWAIHIRKRSNDYSSGSLRFYVEGDTLGFVENSLYGRVWGVYPVTNGFNLSLIDFYDKGNVRQNSYPKVVNTKNYITHNEEIYMPTPVFLIKMGNKSITPLQAQFEDITGTSVSKNTLFEIRKKVFYYYPLFTFFLKGDEFTSISERSILDYTLNGENSSNLEPVYENILVAKENDDSIYETAAYDVQTGLEFHNEDFKFTVGKAKKDDFYLFYDGFSYKNQHKSFFHVKFPPKKTLSAIEFEVFKKVNEYRLDQGLPEMVLNINLKIAAQRQIDDMVARPEYYSNPDISITDGHKGIDGSVPADRSLDAGFLGYAPYSTPGHSFGRENLTWITAQDLSGEENVLGLHDIKQLAEDFVIGWINSPPHNANLIEPLSLETGIASGLSADGKTFFVCQTYGYIVSRPLGISPLVKLSEYIKNNFTWAGEEDFIPEVYLV